MLTGDENIIDVQFTVQYRIANLEDFLFNLTNPDITVKAAAESAMREVIGDTGVMDALTEGKGLIETNTAMLLQETLNSYRSGLHIQNIKLQDVHPPEQVRDGALHLPGYQPVGAHRVEGNDPNLVRDQFFLRPVPQESGGMEDLSHLRVERDVVVALRERPDVRGGFHRPESNPDSERFLPLLLKEGSDIAKILGDQENGARELRGIEPSP